MIDVIWNKIKPYLTNIVNCTAFFVVVYLIAWALNGIYNMRFNMGDLTTFYLLIAGKQIASKGIDTAKHGINSVYNSPQGVNPNENKGDKK